MRKQILLLLSLIAFCLSALCPLHVGATPIDPSANATLTLHYTKDGQAFPDLEIGIYRVAEAFPDGTFELTEPFSSYPISIHGITAGEQWEKIAATLDSCIAANQLSPHRAERTDGTGTAVFEQAETGLYLVTEVIAENKTGTYVFNRFMVYLPTPQADGSFDYTVEAVPKCVSYVPKTEYRVTKLWQDGDNRDDRPEKITADIYKDGVLYESCILSGENNWTYLWYVSEEDPATWTVAERSVSEDYTVSVQQSGGSFSIINTHKSVSDIPDSPQTGDTRLLLPRLLIMSISGIVLIAAGVYRRRKRGV